MSLAPGVRFGSYEVIALLGAGGMGEVYRARDLKLNREVALKVLPEQFALDPDRAARFKREAELLASLNHPNIAAAYGREDADGDPVPYSWSPDGKFILHRAVVGGTFHIGFLSMIGERNSEVLQPQSNFTQSLGQLSSDGRWIAYQSVESGRYEIYAQSFPAPGGKWQISRDGGVNPRWRADGKEIFYYAPDGQLMAVPVMSSNAALNVGTAVPLFKARMLIGPIASFGFRQQYDVTPDGGRFLINVPVDETTSSSTITVVLNWPAALKK